MPKRKFPLRAFMLIGTMRQAEQKSTRTVSHSEAKRTLHEGN